MTMPKKLRALICRIFHHSWRISMSTTNIFTGAGEREEFCSRCGERQVTTLPARRGTP